MKKLLPALAAALLSGTGALAAEPCADLTSRIVHTPEAVRKSPATAQVRALFDAANRGDEAAFGQLLATIARVGDYEVEGDNLLHRLLRPAQALVDDEAAWRKKHPHASDEEHWAGQQRKHAELFAAKTRMLAMALRSGVNVREGDGDGAAPLHVAALYGTAEMVRMLLDAGADAGQVGRFRTTRDALESTLSQEGMWVMEGIVTPAERTRVVLALLDAGAPLPGQRLFDLDECHRVANKEERLGLDRPMADFQLWGDLLALTSGREVLDRMAKLGTRPYTDEGGRHLFAYAAKAGNVAGVAWLKDNVDRYDKDGSDRWVDGAIWALRAPRESSGPLLDALLVADLKWQQQGPVDIRHHGSASRHVPRTDREGSLLDHAVRAGRADVVRRLAALGAPVTPNGDHMEGAVIGGDVTMVRTLLDLGASPLGGEIAALELAVVPEDDERLQWLRVNGLDGRNPPSLEQRKQMLALLLAALRERNMAVPTKSSVLDWAMWHAQTAEGAALARMVLDAGVSAKDAQFDTVQAALASPDRALFGALLGNGLMDGVDADGQRRFAGALVREAASTNRADVLPALLALQPDLGWRGEDGLRALDIATRKGNVALVETLLAAGAAPSGPGSKAGTALDHAIVSRNAGMVRLIAAKTGQPLDCACVPDTDALARMVRTADDAFWSMLRGEGFGARRCAGMAPRLVAQLSDTLPTLYAGWLGERMRQRMADLRADDARAGGDAATAELLRRPVNGALAKVLQQAGWPAPAGAKARSRGKSASAADRALRKKLPGDYGRSGRELVSAMRLRADGTFSYMLMYGAVDEELNGLWSVEDGRLRLTSKPAPAGAETYKPVARKEGAVPAGMLAVDVYYRGRVVPGVEVTAFGDQPAVASGMSEREGWQTSWRGPVRQIALSHKAIGGGRPYVFEVPAAQATQTGFAFAVPDELPNRTFDESLAVEGDELVWQRTDGTLSLRRKAAAAKERQ